MKTTWLLGLVCALAVAGCGDDGSSTRGDDAGDVTVDMGGDVGNEDVAEAFDATGIWRGTYSSTAPGRDISGQVIFEMFQEGDGLTGTAQFTNAPCLTSVRFEGTVTDNVVEFRLIDDNDLEKEFVVAGTLSTDTATIDGTYDVPNWGICTGSYGVLSATRD